MVGIQAATCDSDSIITSYRDHCTHIAKGGTLLEVIAECMGRVDGASKGYGGSMHMYNKVRVPGGLGRGHRVASLRACPARPRAPGGLHPPMLAPGIAVGPCH